MMNRRTIFFLSFLAVICTVIYLSFFTTKERRADHVRDNIRLLKVGMAKQQVYQVLSRPDTAYYEKDVALYFDTATIRPDSVLVLQYYLGLGSPDALRVFVKDDTVIKVVSNN